MTPRWPFSVALVLPDDVEALRALILAQTRELDALKGFQAEVERLKAIIAALQRHRLGRRSEQFDPDQFELALEEVETALAEAEHARDRASRIRPINRAGLIATRSPPISSGSNKSSISRKLTVPGPTLAVAASFIRLAQMWWNASMSCRPPSACWSPVDRAIWLAWTSNCCASSASVFSPFKAAKATFALNAEL